ncbi:MAG: ABC transporter permease [Acetobacteraceae bacterium]
MSTARNTLGSGDEPPPNEAPRGTEAGRAPSGPRRARVQAMVYDGLATYGLAAILVALFVAFSIAMPGTFPTRFNIESLLSGQAVTALLALAVMVPITVGQWDLSVGFFVGLAHILTLGLQVQSGLPWPVASLAVVLAGVLLGLLNGWLITSVGIDSFIATLGSGTFVFGLASWYTGGKQVLGNLHNGFYGIDTMIGGLLPSPALCVIVVAIVLWILLEYRPLGRRLYAIGANPRAAELTGISPKRYIPWTFVGSGVITALAGIMLASELHVGQTSVGPDYLLPAFTGALLGATAIRPGRVNVWGTVIAVMLLAVIVSGLEQTGAEFFVAPLFNGLMLVTAVGLSLTTARRRAKVAAAANLAEGANGR